MIENFESSKADAPDIARTWLDERIQESYSTLRFKHARVEVVLPELNADKQNMST